MLAVSPTASIAFHSTPAYDRRELELASADLISATTRAERTLLCMLRQNGAINGQQALAVAAKEFGLKSSDIEKSLGADDQLALRFNEYLGELWNRCQLLVAGQEVRNVESMTMAEALIDIEDTAHDLRYDYVRESAHQLLYELDVLLSSDLLGANWLYAYASSQVREAFETEVLEDRMDGVYRIGQLLHDAHVGGGSIFSTRDIAAAHFMVDSWAETILRCAAILEGECDDATVYAQLSKLDGNFLLLKGFVISVVESNEGIVFGSFYDENEEMFERVCLALDKGLATLHAFDGRPRSEFALGGRRRTTDGEWVKHPHHYKTPDLIADFRKKMEVFMPQPLTD
jgi:hypothetical protein